MEAQTDSVIRVTRLETDDGSIGEELAESLVEFVAEATADPDGRTDRCLRSIAAHIPIAIWRIDASGTLVQAYGGALARLGVNDHEFLGLHVSSFGPEAEAQIAPTLAGQSTTFEVAGTGASGSWMFTCRVVPLPRGLGAVAVSVDVTDSHLAAERMRESEERTRAILESAGDGIITFDESGRIVEFNAAAERMFGYDSDEAIGMEIGPLMPAAERDSLVIRFADFVDKDRKLTWTPSEVTVTRRDGSTFPVEVVVTDVHTSMGHLFTAVIHDVTERLAFEHELEHQSTHDALTGLPNRVLLTAQLEASLARANRRQNSVGVLLVGLDRLKLVSDTLGHRVGDEIIIETGRRLSGIVSSVGVVTRFAGDEFVVICEDLDDVGDAVEIANRIIESMDRPFRAGGEEAFLATHVGIAFAELGLGIAEQLVSNSDVAMVRARQRGASSFEVFDTDMRASVDTRRKLEIALRHGIERDEFELYYQPIVSVGTRDVLGVEALVRWNHPLLGVLPPSEFIPLAEESGLILALGESLLVQACERLAEWQKIRPDWFVSVNLSGRQVVRSDLVETVDRCLREAGASPEGLHLEITETVLLNDVEAAARSLDGLKRIGTRLCLDDFGTGYSSLTYLCRFPIDTVKIDRSFISQLGVASRDSSIVTMIVGMAQTLQLEVIAEGVETQGQLDALHDLDCGFAQGYLFARPQQIDHIAGFMDR